MPAARRPPRPPSTRHITAAKTSPRHGGRASLLLPVRVTSTLDFTLEPRSRCLHQSAERIRDRRSESWLIVGVLAVDRRPFDREVEERLREGFVAQREVPPLLLEPLEAGGDHGLPEK